MLAELENNKGWNITGENKERILTRGYRAQASCKRLALQAPACDFRDEWHVTTVLRWHHHDHRSPKFATTTGPRPRITLYLCFKFIKSLFILCKRQKGTRENRRLVRYRAWAFSLVSPSSRGSLTYIWTSVPNRSRSTGGLISGCSQLNFVPPTRPC